MSSPPGSLALAAHLAVLSMISFGGIPTVLPDIHNLVVVTKGWVTDQEFADFYAIAQAMPGLPMILMMSLIGWKVGGADRSARQRGRDMRAIIRRGLRRLPFESSLPRRVMATNCAPRSCPSDGGDRDR